jgi:hypothetical protein
MAGVSNDIDAKHQQRISMEIKGIGRISVLGLLASGMLFGTTFHEAAFAQSNLVATGQDRGEANTRSDFTGKRVKAYVVSQELGDVACYLTLRDDAGRETMEMADFDLCTRNPRLQGKNVELGFTPKKVMNDSCGGDPACKKTRQIQLAITVKIIGESAQPPMAGGATEQVSHCTATETVVFACRTGAKLVSVCADPASGPKTGYMQYRFGKPERREALEISWPERLSPPSAMSSGDVEAFSGGGAAWLRIRKGDYAYVVYSGIGRWGSNGQTQSKEGIVVEHRAKTIASLKCSQPVTSELGPAWFGKVGIQSRGELFDLPD